MLKPKVGDLVRLKPMRVVSVATDYIRCYGGESFGFDSIEDILPRPLAVGDRVRFVLGDPDRPSDARGTVMAVYGEMAWVHHDYEFGSHRTSSMWSTFNTR